MDAETSFLDEKKPVVTMGFIAEVVAKAFDVTVKELRGKRRSRYVARPRQIAMYLTRDYFGTKKSYPTIGSWYQGRDHSTVIHACRVVEGLMRDDSGFNAKIEFLRACIQGSEASRSVREGVLIEGSERMGTSQLEVSKTDVASIDNGEDDEDMVSAQTETYVCISAADVKRVITVYFVITESELSANSEAGDYYQKVLGSLLSISECLNGKPLSWADEEFTRRVDSMKSPLLRNDLSEIWEILTERKQQLS